MSDDNNDYQFEDAETARPAAPAGERSQGAPRRQMGGGGGGGGGHMGSDGSYADEIFSKRIDAKFRTFFVDLKESVNGKFIKISEKSRGRKSTIMLDAEDVPSMIAALQEVQTKL